jgi:hypothetical protein
MAYLNENYFKLKAGYLFPEIARRVATFTSDNKEAAARLIRCGIGDVTEALPTAARTAIPARAKCPASYRRSLSRTTACTPNCRRISA